MAKKCLLVLMMLNSWALCAAELTIEVRDVMDLATYHDVLSESIPLGKNKEVRTFTINEWKTCFDNCEDYSMRIKLEVFPVESGIVSDTAYFVAVVKELLLHGKMIKTLVRERFVVTAGQEKIASDVHWASNGLVVRQENVFSLNK